MSDDVITHNNLISEFKDVAAEVIWDELKSRNENNGFGYN